MVFDKRFLFIIENLNFESSQSLESSHNIESSASITAEIQNDNSKLKSDDLTLRQL